MTSVPLLRAPLPYLGKKPTDMAAMLFSEVVESCVSEVPHGKGFLKCENLLLQLLWTV
jgi:hypothetical protein